MRYVLFDATTREIKSAMTGPEPSAPQGQLVGDVGDVQFDGALKNYVFVAAEPLRAQGATRGRVQRKPETDWDLRAEQDETTRQKTAMRFHQLDVNELRAVETQLMFYASFKHLPVNIAAYQVLFEGVALDVEIRRLAAAPISATFELGGGSQSGYTVPLGRSLVAFRLTGEEKFLRDALDQGLRRLDDIGRKLFASHVLKREALWFGLRLTNHLIDCYRLAYRDWEARPVGIADVLDGVIVLELVDGARQAQHSALPAMRYSSVANAAHSNVAAADVAMHELLRRPAPPFIPIAVAELRKAHLYGQYREVVVWAATIVANVIEDILLKGLQKDSPEYRRLQNSSKAVSGATRRGEYFVKATGQTLREWLQGRVTTAAGGTGLADEIEELLGMRNLLLHRRRAVTFVDGERAFGACMAFLAVVENVPYWREGYPYEF